jgi:hypothetical protein
MSDSRQVYASYVKSHVTSRDLQPRRGPAPPAKWESSRQVVVVVVEEEEVVVVVEEAK